MESLVSRNCIHQGEMCSAIFIDNKKIVLKFLFGCVSNSSNIRLQLLLNMEQILKYIHLSLQPTSQILTINIWYIWRIILFLQLSGITPVADDTSACWKHIGCWKVVGVKVQDYVNRRPFHWLRDIGLGTNCHGS